MAGRPLSRAAVVLFLAATGCGKLDEECRAVTARANTFLAETAKLSPKQGVSREQTETQALAMAARYEKLATDLAAIRVTSPKLQPEVESYRALALRSAAALRAVASALSASDFEAARKKRVDLDGASKGEAPLVARINKVCGR